MNYVEEARNADCTTVWFSLVRDHHGQSVYHLDVGL